jgi:CRISPR-associated protein Cmr6
MPIAAVPNYLGHNFQNASPGLRFGMYLPIWRDDWEKEKDLARLLKENVCALTPNDRKTLEALDKRQKVLASLCDKDALFIMDAKSIAPFSTGLGNEHPLENGFAFLNPYGLPYLPGSGVKGVLRQAARELASGKWEDKRGWDDSFRYSLEIEKGKPIQISMLDVLFGRESEHGETEHVRGALSFWDVIPQIQDNKQLAVDIMTPHQSHYYQDKATPHESGKPIPINFLTVPPGSDFVFHVQCDRAHLEKLARKLLESDENGKECWRNLLAAAFEHAFDWLGFGAKTSVGYGAMESGAQRQQREEFEANQTRQRQQQNAQAWEGARVKFNAKNGSLSVEKNGETAYAHTPEGERLFKSLPQDIQQKIKGGQFVKITAHVSGIKIVRVTA